jgi:hypothetical protein
LIITSNFTVEDLMTPNFALLMWHEYRKRARVLEGLLPECMGQNLRLFRGPLKVMVDAESTSSK